MGNNRKYGLEGLFGNPVDLAAHEEEGSSPKLAGEQNLPRKVGRPRKSDGHRITDRTTRVTFLADVGTMSKVRAIAAKEQLTIKDVIDTALREIIRRYEEKHGEVEPNRRQGRSKTLMDVL